VVLRAMTARGRGQEPERTRLEDPHRRPVRRTEIGTDDGPLTQDHCNAEVDYESVHGISYQAGSRPARV
jgi:hypothetical protein